MRLSKIAAVFFDFDGVLCTDLFYTTLLPEYAAVVQWIGRNIFGGEKYCDSWMRGELTWWDINKIIAAATGIDCELLDEKFADSVRQMKVYPAILKLAEECNRENIKTALVTNNMDIFNEITVPEKRLDKVFPLIVNSYDHGLMKHDDNGRLFDIAREKLGFSNFQNILLIDDSPINCDIFEKKGGKAYLYSNQQAFLKWADESLF